MITKDLILWMARRDGTIHVNGHRTPDEITVRIMARAPLDLQYLIVIPTCAIDQSRFDIVGEEIGKAIAVIEKEIKDNHPPQYHENPNDHRGRR